MEHQRRVRAARSTVFCGERAMEDAIAVAKAPWKFASGRSRAEPPGHGLERGLARRAEPFDLDLVEHPDAALVNLRQRADLPGGRRKVPLETGSRHWIRLISATWGRLLEVQGAAAPGPDRRTGNLLNRGIPCRNAESCARLELRIWKPASSPGRQKCDT